MKHGWQLLGVAAMAIALAGGPRAMGQEKEKPLDLSSIIGGTEPRAQGDELPPGDHARFTINTDNDISTLTPGDVYAAGLGNEKTLYKVVDIPSKGSQGGSIVFERFSGNGEIGDKLGRSSGGGPVTIVRRRTLLDLYIQGGPFLHPIALLGFVTILLGLNSAWIYRSRRQCPPEFVEKASAALKAGDLKKFRKLAMNEKGLLPFVCRSLTERFQSSTIEEIKERAEIAASTQIHRLRIPVKVLNLISAAAPLLGLLGTIVGMVIVFEAVAGSTGAAKAAALAAGIRVKLFSTAAALCVAIPALFLYFIFNARLSTIIGKCETVTERFMHRLALMKRNGVGAVETVEAEEDEEEEADENEDLDEEEDEEEAPPVVVKKGKKAKKVVADDEEEA